MPVQRPHYSIIQTTLILIPTEICMLSTSTIIAYNVLPLVGFACFGQVENRPIDLI